MPRKAKTDITSEGSQVKLLKEVYNDTFNIKTTSVNIMRNISKDINYNDKQEVITILPLVQKQMDIIARANDTLLELDTRLNG
jgi:hypothetical protein